MLLQPCSHGQLAGAITELQHYGDRRQAAPSCVVIVIDQDNVEKFARDSDVPFANYANLTRASQVQNLVAGEVEKVSRKTVCTSHAECPPIIERAHSNRDLLICLNPCEPDHSPPSSQFLGDGRLIGLWSATNRLDPHAHQPS